MQLRRPGRRARGAPPRSAPRRAHLRGRRQPAGGARPGAEGKARAEPTRAAPGRRAAWLPVRHGATRGRLAPAPSAAGATAMARPGTGAGRGGGGSAAAPGTARGGCPSAGRAAGSPRPHGGRPRPAPPRPAGPLCRGSGAGAAVAASPAAAAGLGDPLGPAEPARPLPPGSCGAALLACGRQRGSGGPSCLLRGSPELEVLNQMSAAPCTGR